MVYICFLIKTWQKCGESLQTEVDLSIKKHPVFQEHKYLLFMNYRSVYVKICLFPPFLSCFVRLLGVSADRQRRKCVFLSRLHDLGFISVETKDS